MANKSFKKFYTEDQDLGNLQDNIEDAINPFIKNQFLDGLLRTGIEIVAGDNDIPHKLGRKIQGWVVVDQDATAAFYRKPSSTPTLTIKLNSSANCTISLYIF